MNSNRRPIQLIINKLIFLGILFFILLFVFSSTLYPGGSQANIDTKGFDWLNNYWCNLTSEKAMNGAVNPARVYSISAMIILCLSLMLFFLQFAETFSKNSFLKNTIKVSGILSMSFAIFIFTPYHDLMTIVSSFFGLFVVLGISIEIYKHSSLMKFQISGFLCLLLLGLNNYIYYSQQAIAYLPFLQKITLLIVILWIIGLNYEVRTRINQE